MKPHTGDTLKFYDLIDQIADQAAGVEEGPLGINYNSVETGSMVLPVNEDAQEFLGFGDTVRARITVLDVGDTTSCELTLKPKSIFSREQRTFVFTPDADEELMGCVVYELVKDKSSEKSGAPPIVRVPVPVEVATGLFGILQAAA